MVYRQQRSAGQQLTPGGSTFLREMTPTRQLESVASNPKFDSRFRQLKRVHSKNNPAEFHPDPIWKDRALGFFEESRPNKNNKNKMSSDMRSSSETEQRTKSASSQTDSRYHCVLHYGQWWTDWRQPLAIFHHIVRPSTPQRWLFFSIRSFFIPCRTCTVCALTTLWQQHLVVIIIIIILF